MVRRYLLDSSVAVRILLGHSPAAATWFADAAADPDVELLASRLLRTEVTRVLRREGLPVSRRDEVVDYVGTIPISDAILAEAEAIVPHVKTLDAIHLATALVLGAHAVVVSHDTQILRVAAALGLSGIDPLEQE